MRQAHIIPPGIGIADERMAPTGGNAPIHHPLREGGRLLATVKAFLAGAAGKAWDQVTIRGDHQIRNVTVIKDGCTASRIILETCALRAEQDRLLAVLIDASGITILFSADPAIEDPSLPGQMAGSIRLRLRGAQ